MIPTMLDIINHKSVGYLKENSKKYTKFKKIEL